MTASELQTLALTRLGEDPTSPSYYTEAETLTALNQGQRLFAFLTLCLETTASFALSANTTWYHLLPAYSGLIVPLRIRVVGGAKLAPARMEDLDALDPSWQTSTGTPTRYAFSGCDLLAVYPKPAGAGTVLDITFARMPADLAIGASPEIPDEDHLALADFAVPMCRAKEGGQEFAKVLPMLDRFMDAVQSRANYMRARNRARGYDREPPELERFDISTMLKGLK
jgi:hypothetical protein